MDTFQLLVGIGIVLVGVVVVVLVLRRSRGSEAPSTPEAPGIGDTEVTGVNVEGDTVVVDFDVVMPPGGDSRLAEALTRAAVDVVRRRSIELDLGSSRVTSVVARTGGIDTTPVGRVAVPEGRLPDPDDILVVVTEASGAEPLLDHGITGAVTTPPVPGPDELPPVGAEVVLPPEVAASLRSAGIDPAGADADQLLDAVLRHGGWTVEAKGDHTHLASRGGRRVLVRVVPHLPGDHPELADDMVTQFVVALSGHPGAEGVLATGKIVPFHLVAKQRQGVRVVGRQRLGSLIDELLAD